MPRLFSVVFSARVTIHCSSDLQWFHYIIVCNLIRNDQETHLISAWFSPEFVDGALNVQNEFVLNIEHKREMGIFSFTKVLINDIEGFYSISIIVSLL